MRNKRYNKVEERVMTDVIDRLTAKCNRLKNDNDYLRATNEVLSDGNIRINKETNNLAQMMKLNSLIMILMSNMLRFCDESDIGVACRTAIARYYQVLAQNMPNLIGDENFDKDQNKTPDANDK